MARPKRSIRYQRAKAIREDNHPKNSPRKTERKKVAFLNFEDSDIIEAFEMSPKEY
jgi:hypothetical protein